jgi:DGQHR domain-containing protein
MSLEKDAAAGTATIPVNRGAKLRSGTEIVTGVMRAGDLVDQYLIPRHDFRKKTGYQRDASTARVNRLATDLKAKRVDLPTAVLFNLRAFDEDVHLVEGDKGLQLRLNGSPLYVVDGQHRTEALKRLINEDPEEWEDFLIPFVCMLGASENEEMEQFHVVNSTAKSVRTDLALVLLKQRAESDPRLMEALIERGESGKVKAQTLVEELEKMSPVWRQRIRFPGEPKGSTVISSAGMVSSLRRPLATPYFGSISQSNQLKVLDAFWQGIRLALPEPFVEPADYVLQKSTGVLAMHGLLEVVVEIIKASGNSVIEADSYSTVLADTLGGLQGDTVEGEVVSGADFWRSGPEGAAGSFSSNAGRRVLLAKLRGSLPDLEVE